MDGRNRYRSNARFGGFLKLGSTTNSGNSSSRKALSSDFFSSGKRTVEKLCLSASVAPPAISALTASKPNGWRKIFSSIFSAWIRCSGMVISLFSSSPLRMKSSFPCLVISKKQYFNMVPTIATIHVKAKLPMTKKIDRSKLCSDSQS